MIKIIRKAGLSATFFVFVCLILPPSASAFICQSVFEPRSVFTRIIDRQIPADIVYEDSLVIAILPLDAVSLGHVLVIPKIQIDHFSNVPPPYYLRVHQVAQVLAKAIQDATGCRRVVEAVLGQEVPHFHLHLVPYSRREHFDFSNPRRYSKDENAYIRDRIVNALKNYNL